MFSRQSVAIPLIASLKVARYCDSDVRFKLIAVLAQDPHELGVNEQFFFPHSLLNQNAEFNQVFEIPRGRLTFCHPLIDQI